MGVYSRLVESRFTQPVPANDDLESVGAPVNETPGLSQVVSNVGERIQEILDAAERVAGEIQAEAETAGAKYLHERKLEADRVFEGRVRELAGTIRTLSARAERLEREAASLVEGLRDANQSMAGITDAAEPELAAKVPERPAASPTGRIPEQALLRATQMAVAGSEREDIESMLRVDFGIEDPTLFLDAILRSER